MVFPSDTTHWFVDYRFGIKAARHLVFYNQNMHNTNNRVEPVGDVLQFGSAWFWLVHSVRKYAGNLAIKFLVLQLNSTLTNASENI